MGAERERMFAPRAPANLACVASCALVGGQDELLFDGHSFVVDYTGETIARAAQFEEDLLICDVDLESAAAARLRDAGHRPAARRTPAQVTVLPPLPPPADRSSADTAPARSLATPIVPLEAEVYAALMLGLRDYVSKNGFG